MHGDSKLCSILSCTLPVLRPRCLRLSTSTTRCPRPRRNTSLPCRSTGAQSAHNRRTPDGAVLEKILQLCPVGLGAPHRPHAYHHHHCHRPPSRLARAQPPAARRSVQKIISFQSFASANIVKKALRELSTLSQWCASPFVCFARKSASDAHVQQISFAKSRSDAVVRRLDADHYEEHRQRRLQHRSVYVCLCPVMLSRIPNLIPVTPTP